MTFSSPLNLQIESLIVKILEKEKISNKTTNTQLIISSYAGTLIIYHLNKNEKGFRAMLLELKKRF